MPLIGPFDLAPLTTFGLPARALAGGWRLDSPAELDDLHHYLAGRSRPPLLLGGGSNLLLARDLDEPVVVVRSRGRRIVSDDGRQAVVEIAAGENWDQTVRWALEQGLAGIENLIRIPGTTGAAPWQNIGAYGVELSSVVDSIDAWHQQENRIATFDRRACRFGYRDSVFKQPEMAQWLILTVRLVLERTATVNVAYGEIGAELAAAGRAAGPTAIDVANAVERIRQRKLPDPAELGNAGSFFKNPLIDADQAGRLRQAAAGANLPMPPLFPAGDAVKVSAAWLIDQCGWKGRRIGDAGVSDRHALVLVNHGSATGAEVLDLARQIQAAVQARFGVRLDPEPRIIA